VCTIDFQQIYWSHIEIPHHIEKIFAESSHVRDLLPGALEIWERDVNSSIDSDIGHAYSMR
jgi:hypothetical protein